MTTEDGGNVVQEPSPRSEDADPATSGDVVGAIRDVLGRQGQVDAEHLKMLAERYCRACDELYKKAYRCRDLLRAGMKKQASRLAKASPDLRGEFEAVDFVEAPTWLELCEKLNLTMPPFLDSAEIGGLLDELYTVDATSSRLDKALRVHRRLALGRAPLADRVRVLRAIYQEATAIDEWKEDLLAMEAARVEQLALLAEKMNKKSDLAGLEQVLAELRADDWLSPPAETFLQGVDRLACPHRQRHTDTRCADLVERLRDAHGAMDEPLCRDILLQWQQVCEEMGCQPSAGLAAELAPIRSWLEDIDADRQGEAFYQEACQALEAAIDDEADQAELEKLAAAVLRFDRDMPPLLAARFNSRMEEITRTAKRRFALRLTGTVGVLLLLAGIVVVSILWYNRNREISHWREQISSLLDRKAVDEAGKLLRRCQGEAPTAYASADIQGLRGRYGEAIKKEDDRKEEFQALIEQVAQAGVETPNQEALARAERLARTPREKKEAWDWKRKIQQYNDEQARLRRQNIAVRISELDDLHGRFKQAIQSEDASAIGSASSAVKIRIASIHAMRDLSDIDRSRLDTIEKDVADRVERFRDGAERSREIAVELSRLDSLYSRPGELAKALRAFAAKHPDHELASEFLRAVFLEAYWESAIAWSEFAGNLGPVVPISDAKTAAERLQKIEAFLKDYPTSQHALSAAKYQAYLQTGATAWTATGLRHISDARQVLTNPLLNELFVLKATDGRCFYLKDKELDAKLGITGKPVGYTFKYIVDETLAQKKYELTFADIKEDPKAAAQVAYTAEAMKTLGDLKTHGWETLYLRLAELTRTDKAVDPILRAKLVKTFLYYAVETTPFASDGVRKALGGLDLDLDLYWMDPEDEAANRKRKQIATILDTLDSLDSLIGGVERDTLALNTEVAMYSPAGIILGTQGQIKAPSAPAKGLLYVLATDGKGGVTYKKIGEMSDGTPAVDGTSVSGIPRGTPVFVKLR